MGREKQQENTLMKTMLQKGSSDSRFWKTLRLSTLGAALVLPLTLGACTQAEQDNSTNRSLGGGLIGAGTGAAIGALAGGGRGAAIGALSGGAVGATTGYLTTPNHRYNSSSGR